MDIKNLVLSDEALNVIENGVWVDDFDEAPELGLFVLGWNSQAVRDCLRQKQVHARTQSGGKPLDSDQHSKCVRETLVEAALKNWRGITDDGKPVEYSKDLAEKWITSRNGERFANLVLFASQRVDSQANSFVEQASKN